MTERLFPADDRTDTELAHPLWAFLTTLSGVTDEIDRARLLAGALPSLVAGSVSGVALLVGDEATWQLVVEAKGRQLDADRTAQILAESLPLFEHVFGRVAVQVVTVQDAGPRRVPSSLEKLGVQQVAITAFRTLHHRIGVLFIGGDGTEGLSRKHEIILSILAQHMALGIENLRLNRQLLRRSEQLELDNRLILSAAGEGIYGLDRDGNTTFINPAAIRMLGWESDGALMGEGAHDMHHHTKADGSPYEREDSPIFAAFRYGQVAVLDDEVFWRKDGSSFPVAYTSTPVRRDGELVGAVVVFRDITARKKAETSLRQALAEVEELKNQLEAENIYLQEEIKSQHDFEDILGHSRSLQGVLDAIAMVAETDANVLVLGETGTGKEVIARALHAHSARRDKPLIKVNCASVPRELFESEFFGHVRGAFTGAVKDRQGRFYLADRGTLLLDEVGEIPLEMQSKLLRVLQEGEFERVGDERPRKVDVRVIAVTNRDLEKEVAEGRFRQDLYYRLNVFPIEVPPLRSRLEDVPLIAASFLEQAARRLNRPGLKLSKTNVGDLQAYDWPGNVRELQNVIERAAIAARSGTLAFNLSGSGERVTPVISAEPEVVSDEVMRQRERANLLAALQHAQWRIRGPQGAAELLGIKPTTLASRMKQMGIERLK